MTLRDDYENAKTYYGIYGDLIGWLSVISVFVSMMATYWDTCSGRFIVLISTIITLWVVEVIPPWITALCIPLLVVFLRVMARDGSLEAMDGKEASRTLFSSIFGTVTLTLLAVFIMSKALSRTRRLVQVKWLELMSRRWSLFVLITMVSTGVLSGVMGNIPALDHVLLAITPITANLPADCGQSKFLFAGIMIAANIGGILSPISSAHSIFAYDLLQQEGYHEVSWTLWYAISTPIVALTILLSWILLFVQYCRMKNLTVAIECKDEEKGCAKDSLEVLGVYVLTFCAWISTRWFGDYIGDIGIVSLIPVILIFSCRLLDSQDLLSIPWQIILLSIGGSALSVAAKHSGYLQHVSAIYLVNVHWICFLLIPTIISIYKSQFITGLLFLPAVIASNHGLKVDKSESIKRFFLTFLGSSCGMALPISGMTNMMICELRDDAGIRRMTHLDFFRHGLPATIVAFAISASITRPIVQYYYM